jgi:hypothetical protein
MANKITQAPPPPQQDQPDPSVTLQKFVGLKNTVLPERLGPDELAVAINVDLDDVGQLRRRHGFNRRLTGDWGGLFESDDGQVFGVNAGNLVRVNPDYSVDVLAGGFTTPAPKMAWVQVGPMIYFSSPGKSGKIDLANLAVVPWQGPNLGAPTPAGLTAPTDGWWYSPVVNPTYGLPAIRGKILGPPPVASILAYFNGRIYMAAGRTVWFTELYLYDYVDKTKNVWNFEADVTMIGPVGDGMYVGTTEGVWFIDKQWRMEAQSLAAKRVRVLDFGVIPGSMVYVPAELANPPQVGLEQDTPAKVSILFLTQAGYCGGQDSGVCFNYSENKFIFPNITTAAALFRHHQDGINQFVAVTDGGTWAINTRTGAITEYQNFDFNSFAPMGTTFLAADGTGLWELAGALDDAAQIVADIKSGLMELGGSHFTSFKAAYLAMRIEDNSRDVLLKLVTGDGIEYIYEVRPLDMRTKRVNLGKGLRSRWFSWELIVPGYDFDFSAIEFIPITTQRRV